jgi:hypothetical protein
MPPERKARPSLKALSARHRLPIFYQHWSSGCHSHGFPTLQALALDPRAKDVGVAAVETAFEGAYVNTGDKLPLNQQRYRVRIPFVREAACRSSLGVYPTIMENYCTGGTPWFFVTDPDGVVLQDRSPSTSIGLSERSPKRDGLSGAVRDAHALSPISMRERPPLPASALSLLVDYSTPRDKLFAPLCGASLLAGDASCPQPQKERSR